MDDVVPAAEIVAAARRGVRRRAGRARTTAARSPSAGATRTARARSASSRRSRSRSAATARARGSRPRASSTPASSPCAATTCARSSAAARPTRSSPSKLARDLARPRRPLLGAPRREHRRPCDRRAQGRDELHRRLTSARFARDAASEAASAVPASRFRDPAVAERRGSEVRPAVLTPSWPSVKSRAWPSASATCRAAGRISVARSRSGSGSCSPTRSRAGSPTAHPDEAFENGLKVVDSSERSATALRADAPAVRRRSATGSRRSLWTYWNSRVHGRSAWRCSGSTCGGTSTSRASATRCCSRT